MAWIQYCRWALAFVPCTDEANFTRSGINSLHKLYEWALENCHATQDSSYELRFGICVWAKIVDSYLTWLCDSKLSWQNSIYWFSWKKTSPLIYPLKFDRACDISKTVPLSITYARCVIVWTFQAMGIWLPGLHIFIWTHFIFSYGNVSMLCKRNIMMKSLITSWWLGWTLEVNPNNWLLSGTPALLSTVHVSWRR